MSLAGLTLLAVFAELFMSVSTQIQTNATCFPSYSWMSNSKGQSPCLVAAYVMGACYNGDYSVYNLSYPLQYLPPDETQTNPCTCSTVGYSMLSACGICQGGNIATWTHWSSNCGGIFMSEFDLPIPPETAIPAWAYLDVSHNGFNVTAAQADLNAPESTAVASATSSSLYSTGTYSATKQSNPVAIAGGVVGGLVGITAIAGGVAVFLVRRKRFSRAPSASYGSYSDGQSQSQTALYSPPMSMSHNHQPAYGAGVQPQPRIYDPLDPNTFPPTPNSVMRLSTETTSQSYSQQYYPGRYGHVPDMQSRHIVL